MADSGVPIPPQQILSATEHSPRNGTFVPPPAPEPAKAAAKVPTPPTPEMKDGTREIVETIVFVVVLVLLLKSFVAEAFVIPTGSMAETLWGYQKVIECPKCHYRFPVNCSREVDPQDGPGMDTDRATCSNCRHKHHFHKNDYAWSSGDRVLVAKFLYDLLNQLPERHDVVVFKYPEKPQKGTVPTNYIKRLVGLPGETLAIHYGDLYSTLGLTYPEEQQPQREEDRWMAEFMYRDHPTAVHDFRAGKFQIVRKPPKVMLAERRIVYDNDFQNPDRPNRWSPQGAKHGWGLDNAAQPRVFTSPTAPGVDISWLRYQHLLEQGGKPELITDFMGYNSYQDFAFHNWVGDLMLECEVTPEVGTGELILELVQGVDRFRARFDLSKGTCTLEREGASEKLASKEVVLKPGTKYTLRFANFDQRLTLWVNNAMPFDDGVSYDAPAQRGPTRNDLEPASIGVQGAKVSIAHLKLWRDTYYTIDSGSNDARDTISWSDPENWSKLRNLPEKTMYIQPGHFLCMGDNSPESSDGRTWGVVPRRLLLGRALAVYYPFYFPFWPLDARANRLGSIK